MQRLLSASFFICLPLLCQAQPAVDVVNIRDNFIVAGIAAKQCNTVDAEKQAFHDRNFTLVAKKALEQIVARSPDAVPEELRQQDLTHIEKLQDATFNLVRSEGCRSDKVKALLRMYKIHEAIRF